MKSLNAIAIDQTEIAQFQHQKIHNIKSGNTVMATIFAPNDTDTLLTGIANDDTIFGAAGNDTLVGQGGSDFLDGGRGNDMVFGLSFSPHQPDGVRLRKRYGESRG